MAGSSKKGSIKSPKSPKSPKKTRKAKAAAAPETESVDVNNEDYNIRSPERTQLLTQIKGIIDNAPVSPAFWACCRLADMNCLQLMTNSNKTMILFMMKPLCTLPMQWNQRFRDSAFPGSEAAPQRSEGPKRRKLNSDAQPPVPRSTTECKERDGHKCVLTRTPKPETAHIFPHCMLRPRPKPDRNKPKLSSGIADLWRSLAVFWGEDKINKWKDAIFPDSQNFDIGVERCFNLISLSRVAHAMWNDGVFALKPLNLSRDQKTLTVQFFWQVPGDYEIDSEVDLLTEPQSSEGLDLVGDGYHLTRVQNDGSTPRIRSGETFTFTTKDPQNQPLPSMELLEMQWVLQRLVGMSGAAGWPSLDDIDDDSVEDEDDWLAVDYDDYGVHNSRKRVREWVDAEAAGITPETSTPTTGPSVIECY